MRLVIKVFSVIKVSSLIKVSAALAGAAMLLGPAAAQVAYQPYRPLAPTPYGYPVPYGFLQPDETLGTSPSFAINTDPYNGRPVVRVERRCQYPDGWNLTDFSRDVNGIPAGLDHVCPAEGLVGRRRIHARY